mmetsp:Transcript_19796/g.56876  ORF Transcript_19796/g.56876 Transcript_19796/m.56876 type:complete len:1306 (+) Transcript_19796:127-4044(+)
MPSRPFSYTHDTRNNDNDDDYDAFTRLRLEAFDIDDHRRRDSGLTSSQLLRRKLAGTLRARYHRVRTFSTCGGAVASTSGGGSSAGTTTGTRSRSASESPLKHHGERAHQHQPQHQRKRLSASVSAPEFAAAHWAVAAEGKESGGGGARDPLLIPSPSASGEQGRVFVRYGSTEDIEVVASAPPSDHSGAFVVVASSTLVAGTASGTTADTTHTTFKVFDPTAEEQSVALAVPLLQDGRGQELEQEQEDDCLAGTAFADYDEEGEGNSNSIIATMMNASSSNASSGTPPASSGGAADEVDAAAGADGATHTSSSALRGLTARAAACLLRMPTAADELTNASHPICIVPSVVLTNGKYAALGLPAVWLVICVMWLPLWGLSFLLTELGIYLLVIGTVYKAGRALIRLIAFPGSSHRVYGEIEAEFGRYSCRMLDAACGVVIEAASAIIAVGGGVPPEDRGSLGGGTAPGLMSKVEQMMAPSSQYGYYDLAPLWGRAGSYRDRVLGVYADVLARCLTDGGHDVTTTTSAAATAGAGDEDARTIHGNNPLVGNIGDLSGVAPDAVEEGCNFYELLQRVLSDMTQVDEVAGQAVRGNAGTASNGSAAVSIEARRAAVALLRSATELREMLSGMKPPSASGSGDEGDNADEENPTPHHDDDENMDALRRRLQQEKNASPMEAIKHGAASVLPMLDPPPHSSVFGLDVLRGCMLSRYRGAKQIWVPRSGVSGRIDVLYLPSPNNANDSCGGDSLSGDKRKAVLYCNPNAGLMEVASGMSLIGGNVATADGSSGSEQENCWVDFYTQRGYDIYLFNYAGFGRSSGTRRGPVPASDRTPGSLGRILRIIRGSFWDFAPSPKSMKSDALSVAKYIVDEVGVEHFVIHGESIGGMAASAAAKGLGAATGVCVGRGLSGPLDVPSASQPSLLICDRSFCNLEAVAERLVGGWSGKAIRMLTPFWNTDVAGDFIAARCPKIVANDAADSIIADASALKSGLAVAKEMRKGATWGVSRMASAPVQYRMADWENVGVSESKFFRGFRVQPPVWPADKYISLQEAYHFAACSRRIGKVATALRKELSKEARRRASSGLDSEDEEGIEITELHGFRSGIHSPTSPSSPTKTKSEEDRILDAWKALALCDGMCGAPLGSTIKEGYDCTVNWLCSTVTYGVQVIAEAAERREQESGKGGDEITVLPPDFSPLSSIGVGGGLGAYPVPIPEVLTTLKGICDEGTNLLGLESELGYCISVLEYIVARASAPSVVADSLKVRQLSIESETTLSIGCFLNLNCGHNNQYSAVERERLWRLLQQVTPR